MCFHSAPAVLHLVNLHAPSSNLAFGHCSTHPRHCKHRERDLLEPYSGAEITTNFCRCVHLQFNL